jgi:asparagine N-glycosylation enzyme membrane subunit Stt3
MDKKELNENWNKFKKFISNEKTQWILFSVLFIGILLLGIFIRIQPVVNGNLIDTTTNDYTPLALDPYYFLRVSETIIDTEGDLPAFDFMRDPANKVPWHHEILPESMVWTYKLVKVFDSDVSFRLINVLNPVVFFVLGLILFGILVYILTKNKWISLISAGILTVIPPYLYRTLAGFSDHESIGMFGFFLALLFFAYGLTYLEKEKLSWIRTISLGLLAGFATIFAVASWGGIAKFLFMILPLAFLVIWFTKDKKSFIHRTLFYFLWFFGVLIFGLLFGFNPSNVLKANMLSTTGILSFFTLGFIFLETIILKSNLKEKVKKNSKKVSFIGVILLGIFFYQLFVGDILVMVGNVLKALIYPFGTDRVGVTVAENAQPYLNDLIAQIGKGVYYIFLLGCFITGFKISQGIKIKKLRPLFSFSYAFFIIGILYSRLSSGAVLNGTSFISKALFFISFLVFAISTIYIYNKSEWKIKTNWVFIAAWMIPMLLAVRSAARVFFAIVPFISFMVPVALFEIGKWGKKSKEELVKMLAVLILILAIVFLVINLSSHYQIVKAQAENQGPSYDANWQKAMEWVRDNTPEDAIFLHWWDYGYWVQTGGERATFSDGGHAAGAYGDHLVGRYVLTTPYPETAKSFMKANNITYLLIDPTDIGKYPAYSSIGDDEEISDRESYLISFVSNPNEIQETRNETIRIYSGGIYVDEDLIYEDENGSSIFLPEKKAIVVGFIVGKSNDGNYSQPIGVYSYNGKQHRIPLRYLAKSGKIIDFGSGLNATAFLYANLIEGNQIDAEGALMYLSPKTKDSLVAQLYLMNDPQDLYPELELVREQSSFPLPFYYQNFRGPIKIWKVNLDEMENIIAREEFLERSGEYGGLDGLQFVR